MAEAGKAPGGRPRCASPARCPAQRGLSRGAERSEARALERPLRQTNAARALACDGFVLSLAAGQRCCCSRNHPKVKRG